MISRMALLSIALAACAAPGAARTPASGPVPPSGRIIDAEAIAKSRSGNAWDLLREHAVINVSETAARGQYRLQSRRGRSSLLLQGSDVPLVVVDGVRLIEIGTLRQVPANVIRRIRVLSPIEGTMYMGTNAGGGVIVIETSARRR